MSSEPVKQASLRISAKESSETIKNWIDIFKAITALIILAALLYLFGCDRQRLKTMADELGVERLSGPGVEIALSASSDALPRSQAALQQAHAQIRLLQGRYANAVGTLQEVQRQLAASNAALAPEAQQSVATVLQRAPETLRASQRTALVLGEAQTRTDSAIAQLPGSGDSSLGYGVVFGGDRDESEARTQLNFARGLPGLARLFRRQGYYRSVVVYPTRDAAAGALPRIRALNRYSTDAYLVTLASWCPRANLNENPIAC